MRIDIDVSCRVTTPNGWLELNKGIYRISTGAFEEQAQTWRRTNVANPFVEGQWTVNALRENVTEQLIVWVRGGTAAETSKGELAVVDALSQMNYGIELTVDGVKAYYTCYVADISVRRTQEFRASKMCQITAQVPRDPHVRIEEVA